MRFLKVTILLLCISIYSIAQKDTASIHAFINTWHRAASDANAELFFNSIDDNGIYIGTDASERWTKKEFYSFAKPYFDKGKAWDFKPYNRDLNVSNDGRYAWFSELLTTWMGVCRGSGILQKTSKGWKIEQYHLSVTVPNELVKDFLQLVENYEKVKK